MSEDTHSYQGILEQAGIQNKCPKCKQLNSLTVYSTERQGDRVRIDCFCNVCGTGASTSANDPRPA